MAPNQRILRFAQSRKKSAFVLVQAASTGRHPLDLKLIGTDGFSPFVVTLRQDRVLSLKHSCPDEEWEEILITLFSQKTIEGIQATARVEETQNEDEPPSHLTIEVRRSVQGITKHMGDITLRYKPEEPIDVVDWCNTSILAYEEATAALEKEGQRVSKLEKELEILQNQLNELVDAKKADENDLLEKFRDLLNEKKVKIREQQRLLDTSSHGVPPTVEDSPEAAPPSPKVKKEPKESQRHIPGPSRRGKRKQATPPVEEESSDEDGFEKMDTDEPANARPLPDSEDERTTTAGSEEDVTASEDEEEAAPPPTKLTRRAASARTSTKVASQTVKSKTSEKAAEGAPPPKRELPFATRKKGGAAKAKPPPQEGSETESDDEL
ncbi:Mitotic apparatus protein p62-like protein [Scedosporium apiospermum]|uniref:Mitotic apparatus protein p62-like protein n=1 Tax=Pseudallescheria apiosperma TaxID=563466 RepID=A0A084G8Y1_PSEDA|nr:Mitotic apparatus protein p62-like protein [Scedosporium apiospermum]KEZ43793.1 Mitotic apparatus protein p62-like protein [Scedosporium apiospermum]